MAKYIEKAVSISTFKIKQCKLAHTVTVLCTPNFACTNVRAKPFYVHENQCTQILNLSSPVVFVIRCIQEELTLRVAVNENCEFR